MSDEYLQPIDDGLLTRPSQEYARQKLGVLKLYLGITNTSMRDKWRNRCYIDLQAGPGKIKIGSGIELGSPLIALTAPHPTNHFFFNELGNEEFAALKTRTVNKQGVRLFQQDVNVVVDEVIQQVRAITPRSLNVAFLDPEGLELKWETVSKLANVPSTDLIINFSTGGVRRAQGRGHIESVDSFFGTTSWRDLFANTKSPSSRELIDFYLMRLGGLGYQVKDIPKEVVARNSKNAEVYSVIFASRHPLGDKFWAQAETYTNQPRLL
ncbi:MAG: three-Cys-motif partner protein TcmP [Anaerolineae bacterium]|jgi:three-Cys-motif partner protein|nr:three-Cys-motif partner protein TcmP [Anaerolineae bacterium]